MKITGIDIGSTSIKGAVLDLAQDRVGHVVRKPFPRSVAGLPAGHVEIDPGKVVELTRSVILDLLDHAPDSCAIVACGQMGGVVLTGDDRNPRCNYISWQDQRTLETGETAKSHFARLLEGLEEPALQRLGHEFKPGTAPAILNWMARNGTLPASATPLSLGDYVMATLCQAAPRTELTNALGALDVSQGQWSRELLENLRLDHLDWPPLSRFDRPLGHFSYAAKSIPCYPVVGDHQCSLAGALLSDGELSLNVSTGSQVSMLSSSFSAGNYQVRPWFGTGVLKTITHIPAGRSLNVLVDLVTETVRDNRDPWPYILRAAAEAEESDLRVDLGFFDGPMGNQGSITGIKVGNFHVGSLFRAAFRTMAGYYSECSERIAPQRNWRRIAFSGGLVQKIPMLRDFIVEALSTPYRVCRSEEDTLAGLIILGKVILGVFGSIEEAIENSKRYNPN